MRFDLSQFDSLRNIHCSHIPVQESLTPIIYVVNAPEHILDSVQATTHAYDYVALPYERFSDLMLHYDFSVPHAVVTCFERYDAQAANLLTKIQTKYPEAQILVLVQNWEINSIVKAIRNGVKDIFAWNVDRCEFQRGIVSAIKCDQANRTKVEFQVPTEILDKLTTEEAKIFCLLIQGKTTKQVGAELDLSVRTIHYRKKSIFEKLGVANRLEAVEIVRRCNGLKPQAVTVNLTEVREAFI